jgi:RNA polymerase I-specific transcription initiation factor RRN7
MKSVSPQSDPQGMESGTKRVGSDYQCYKDVDELKGVTKRLYEVAAEVAGLSLRDLLRAVYSLEQMLLSWQKEEKRRLRRERRLKTENGERW